MSVSGGTWHKLSLVQSVQAADGTLSSLKLGSVTLSSEVGGQLAGSTIEFEFVQIEAESTKQEPESLAKVLIGL